MPDRDRLRIAAQKTAVPQLRIAIESAADVRREEEAVLEAMLTVSDRTDMVH